MIPQLEKAIDVLAFIAFHLPVDTIHHHLTSPANDEIVSPNNIPITPIISSLFVQSKM